eukprot:Mycagemm_TRINITY_DN10470_c0_g1::TRINITY_DN10470_c0_g1_i1::g.1492::m.1492 type:complete len:118 gc:universal TRINITY_DN10470_c0_g1_i1:872-519(-)
MCIRDSGSTMYYFTTNLISPTRIYPTIGLPVTASTPSLYLWIFSQSIFVLVIGRIRRRALKVFSFMVSYDLSRLAWKSASALLTALSNSAAVAAGVAPALTWIALVKSALSCTLPSS